jgi:hypothetical protein
MCLGEYVDVKVRQLQEGWENYFTICSHNQIPYYLSKGRDFSGSLSEECGSFKDGTQS